MRVKINSTGEIKEVKQVGDKLFDKENNWYLLSNVILLDNWHPASELPVIPEGKNWVKVVALVDYGDNTLRPRHEIYKDKGWSKEDMWTIVWWCYPPEKEE